MGLIKCKSTPLVGGECQKFSSISAKPWNHKWIFSESVILLDHSLEAIIGYSIKYVVLYFIHPLFAACYQVTCLFHSFYNNCYKWSISIWWVFIEILAVFVFIFDYQKNSRFKRNNLWFPIYSFICNKVFTSLFFATNEPVRADLDHLIIGSMSISHYILASSFSCNSCATGHLYEYVG